jgi:hypothetical protein
MDGMAALKRNGLSGRRGRTRTGDPLLRRQMLYPPELRARHASSFLFYITYASPLAEGGDQMKLKMKREALAKLDRRASARQLHLRVLFSVLPKLSD